MGPSTPPEFKNLAQEYEFRHVTTSPYHPQGNGEAKRAVGTIKGLLQKSEDMYGVPIHTKADGLQPLSAADGTCPRDNSSHSSCPAETKSPRPHLSLG